MRVLTVVGARPQFIKASVVSAQFAAMAEVSEVLVHTGQHFDPNMSDVFFQELGMRAPEHSLAISGGGHGEMTGRMLIEIERVLLLERPDVVLVYGDTNSTLAGALAAAKLHLPVAHVEAGLRSFNVRMPEEINRILTDQLSTWLFAPTQTAVEHLRREGAREAAIHLVGDVMYDVALYHGERAFSLGLGVLERLQLRNRGYILVTVHRAENSDVPRRLAAIVDGLVALSRNLRVVWPLHPRTRAALDRHGLLERVKQAVTLIEPQGYLDMVRLEKCAAVIATDSGGVQKEAFFHGVPCVTLRDETEWGELVDSGWNVLCPPLQGEVVCDEVLRRVGTRGGEMKCYGDGGAARAVVERLVQEVRC